MEARSKVRLRSADRARREYPDADRTWWASLKEERVLGETLSVMVRGMRAWASKDLREVL